MSGGNYDLARQVSRQLFDTYDQQQNGILDNNSISNMMKHTYQIINKGFEPSIQDVETYKKVLDNDCDGQVTYRDIEKIALKYLVGFNEQQI